MADTKVAYNPGGFLSAGKPLLFRRLICYRDWLVQSQDPNVRLISQTDIVMCFIYNMSALWWQCRGRCHSDTVTISNVHWVLVFQFNNFLMLSRRYHIQVIANWLRECPSLMDFCCYIWEGIRTEKSVKFWKWGSFLRDFNFNG